MNIGIIKDTIINDSIILKDSIYTFNHNISLAGNSDDSGLTNNVITISLALVAAVIALYQVKSNIISSARITWIENLRETISNYTVEVSKSATILKNIIDQCKDKEQSEVTRILDNEYPKYLASNTASEILAKKVFLYLNSQEKEHLEIEALIKKTSLHLSELPKTKELDRDEIEANIEQIIKISKGILKKEWNKSKRIFKL